MGKKILVVDDNFVNQITAKSFLKKFGYEVFLASDGVECLELYKKYQPDLIIMDLHMPNMDGFTATRKIRSEKTQNCLPIFALTAYANPEDKVKCRDSGFNEYFQKPFNVEELLATIKRYL